MDTPYKNSMTDWFGSPAHSTIQAMKDSTDSPDLMKLLQPSLLILSDKKIETTMSPVTGSSVFHNNLEVFGTPLANPIDHTKQKAVSNTRRRLLCDSQEKITSLNQHSGVGDIYLERLHSNPLFEDLSKILSDECLHMQTPTNLMNVTWDSSRTGTVHAAHLQLQNKFLHFRAKDKFQAQALEIESTYSKCVSKLEIDRYVEIGLSRSHEHFLTVHEKFDQCRFQLINQATSDLNELVTKDNKEDQTEMKSCKRRLTGSVSPLSDSQYDSGLSSDDNSVEYQIQNTKPKIDVLGLAMAAADILPTPDLTQHDLSHTFTDISSLLEIFPVPRQDVVTCQQATQQPTYQNDSCTARPNLKRKLETTQDSTPTTQQRHKRPRNEQALSKPRQITPDATRTLNEWYDNHVQYPYPTEEDVSSLISLTNLTSPQVKKWMANKRVRCFNTLSITGNKHPIKTKLAGKKKNPDSGSTYKQLSEQSKQVLSDWYEKHIDHPYPSETEKQQLATFAQITVAQVKSWFANRRSRASNRRRQVPNYFLEKFPEYTPHVQMVQVHRDQSRRRTQTEQINNYQNCYY